jgi:DNA-binding FrmR family transcriptional regulator
MTYTNEEAQRQIQALWDSIKDINDKVDQVTAIKSQVDLVVQLLMERGLPECAKNDTRLTVAEDKIKHIEDEELKTLREDVEQIKSTNRVLKWLSGIVSAAAAGIGADLLLKGHQ